MFEDPHEPSTLANVSATSRAYLGQLGFTEPDLDLTASELIWMHALAIGYSPVYLRENADGIRQDWPRIPLPSTKAVLLSSAALGRRVADLLDTERPVPGITTGKLEPLLNAIAVISKTGGGALDPAQGHLELTVGWGRAGKDGACMPGKGRIVVRRQKHAALIEAFGAETLDIFLNDDAYWANIPKPVWGYLIGGYQVIKKWLSYRERPLLGRGLHPEEAEYVTEMARRIAALMLLQNELDSNYQKVANATWDWPED